MIFFCSDDIRDQMKKKYLANPEYDFEKINRASHACGPMVKWAIAQVSYAEMLKKVTFLYSIIYFTSYRMIDVNVD